MDCCDFGDTLLDTKDCLSNITSALSKLVGVKFRKLPGNINYSVFPSG